MGIMIPQCIFTQLCFCPYTAPFSAATALIFFPLVCREPEEDPRADQSGVGQMQGKPCQCATPNQVVAQSGCFSQPHSQACPASIH